MEQPAILPSDTEDRTERTDPSVYGQEFSLAPHKPEPTPFSLAPSPAPVSDGVATKRASYAYYGLSSVVDKKFEEYKDKISSGQENDLRREVAADITEQKANQRFSQLQDTLTNDPDNAMGAIKDLYNTPPVDHKSVFEDYLSSRYMDNIYSVAGYEYSPFSSVFKDDVAANPTGIRQVVDMGKDLLSTKTYLEKWKDDIQDKVEHQSTLGYIGNIAADVATLGMYREIRPRFQGQGLKFEGTGTAKERLAEQWYSMPASGRKEAIDSVLGPLMNSDPQMALDLVNYAIGKGTEDVTFDNAMSAVNFGTLMGPGILRTAGAVKSMLKASAAMGARGTTVANFTGIGDIGEAAIRAKAQEIVRTLSDTRVEPVASATREALETLPNAVRSSMNEGYESMSNFGAEYRNRLSQYIDPILDRFQQLIAENMRVNKVPFITSAEDGARAAAEESRNRFRGLNSHVVNEQYAYDPAGNTHWHNLILGRADATPFRSNWEARDWAKAVNIPLKGSEIGATGAETLEREGLGWYVKLPVPYSVIGPSARAYLVPDNERIDLMGRWINSALTFKGRSFRTPEEVVTSLEALANRQIATYGPSNYLELFREAVKPILALSPKHRWTLPGGTAKAEEKWDQFQRMLTDGQTMHSPDNPAVQGYFFKGPGEVEMYYRQHFNRSPDLDEVMAYDAFRMVNELDRSMRTIAVYRDMNNAGTMLHNIKITQPFGGKFLKKEQYQSPEFHATRMLEWPGGEGYNVALVHSDGTTKIKTLGGLGWPKKDLERLKDNVLTGKGTLLQMWNPSWKQLAGWNGIGEESHVRYIYTEQSVGSRPVPWQDLVPRQGGGHLQNPYPLWVKQANMMHDKDSKRVHYVNDTTLLGVHTEQEGNELIKHFEAVRGHMDKGDESAARAYLQGAGMPWGHDEIIPKFKDRTNPVTGKFEKGLSTKEPIRLVPNDKMVGDLPNDWETRYDNAANGYLGFKDDTKGGSLASHSRVQYTGQRDVYELHDARNIGTRENPLFEINKAKFVDPISMMGRAADRIINSIYMDDMKSYEAERWLKNAEPYLKDKSNIWYYPWAIFQDPESQFINGIPKELKKQLMAEWHMISQFTGMGGGWAGYWDEAIQKLTSSLGPKTARWITDKDRVTPAWLLGREGVGSLPERLRGFVYHKSMGLFNIPQFLVHMFTYVNTAAVAGVKKGSQGAVASLLHLWSTHDASPAMLKSLDEVSTHFGWRPGEWTEARQMLLNSGMKNFEGEYALKDSLKGSNVIQTKWGKILDQGGMFFRGGARSVRVGSYYTAYKEFRDGNKMSALGEALEKTLSIGDKGRFPRFEGQLTGPISLNDRGMILKRADNLAHNMTRASTSIVQKGALTFGSQFAGYNLRLMELLTGKRLTVPEKIRMFGTYALLYGVPATGGIFMLNDMIRKAGIEHGYNVGDNFVSSMVYEGLLSTVFATITGHGDPSKGIYYNFGERYGAHDLDTLSKLASTDTSVMQILGGAAYSTFSDVAERSSGFVHFMNSWIRGDGEFKAKPDDFLDILGSMSTELTSIQRSVMAWNTGKLMTRKGQWVESGLTSSDVLWRHVTGLTNQFTANAYPMSEIIKAQTDVRHKLEIRAKEEMNKGYLALQANDRQGFIDYSNRARRMLDMGGYPTELYAKFFADIAKDNQDMIHRLYNQFGARNVPADSGFPFYNKDLYNQRTDQLRRFLNSPTGRAQ